MTLDLLDAYWRAANYLAVGQIYLMDNPLLREALRLEHIKPRLLGHWGTTPGLNFIYAQQCLDIDAAVAHCAAGVGEWHWAGNDSSGGPDLVMACTGDMPTLETLAAVDLLRTHVPELRVRVINVVDLMTLQSPSEHPHGLPEEAFDALFTRDVPVIFAFHGYPALVHRLIYRRANQGNFHVHGFREEGTTTTPFDMTVLNQLDRFHLAMDAIGRAARVPPSGASAIKLFEARLTEHRAYVRQHGRDMPEIEGWTWTPR